MRSSDQAVPVVGVDVGGSGIKGAVVDLVAGARSGERVRIPTPRPSTPEAVAAVVGEVLERVGGGRGPVGITIPGVVRHGVVHTAANIDQGWLATDAAALFSRVAGRPVVVLNDADAAGVAEAAYGAGKGRPGLVVLLTLGTGIGSALLHDGTLVPNSELGHLHLRHHGSAEAWAADSVREREALSWAAWASRLQEYLELVERVLWPELIILGGGVSKKSDRFIPKLRLRAEVVPAALRNDAGIVGAALAAAQAASA